MLIRSSDSVLTVYKDSNGTGIKMRGMVMMMMMMMMIFRIKRGQFNLNLWTFSQKLSVMMMFAVEEMTGCDQFHDDDDDDDDDNDDDDDDDDDDDEDEDEELRMMLKNLGGN